MNTSIDCFHLLAIVNSATMTLGVCKYLFKLCSFFKKTHPKLLLFYFTSSGVHPGNLYFLRPPADSNPRPGLGNKETVP